MLLSLDKDFLFVHVPKTGGTSVARALDPWVVHPPKSAFNKLLSRLRLQRDPAKVRLRVHGDLRAAYRALPEGLPERLFKFAFVRNPWDRLVSEYSFVMARDNHPRHREVQALDGFAAYLRYEHERARGRSQKRMLDPPAGKPGVDFVGRFERLAEDFDRVAERLGVDVALPHLNRTAHRDYRDFYDDASRAYVAEHWADEIEAFGYRY